MPIINSSLPALNDGTPLYNVEQHFSESAPRLGVDFGAAEWRLALAMKAAGIGGGGGAVEADATLATPQLFNATADGAIAAGARHISIRVVTGTAIFNGYAIDTTNTPIDYPAIHKRLYPAISYTIPPGSVVQIQVIRD